MLDEVATQDVALTEAQQEGMNTFLSNHFAQAEYLQQLASMKEAAEIERR